MPFDFLDQFFPQFGVGHRLAALDDQISLPRNRLGPHLAPAVPVGLGKPGERLARHFKILQNPVVHQRDALGGNAFVVERVKPQQHIFGRFSAEPPTWPVVELTAAEMVFEVGSS